MEDRLANLEETSGKVRDWTKELLEFRSTVTWKLENHNSVMESSFRSLDADLNTKLSSQNQALE